MNWQHVADEDVSSIVDSDFDPLHWLWVMVVDLFEVAVAAANAENFGYIVAAVANAVGRAVVVDHDEGSDVDVDAGCMEDDDCCQ